jgi:segregation and condensation protein B
MSTGNEDARPGGGAAFWAALGVRIEPEPEAQQDTEFAAEAPDADEQSDAADSGPQETAEERQETEIEEAAEPAQSPAIVIPAQAQASIEDVEPQEGEVVDGLAVLSETLAESRRARENAPRPEPAWQLAGELSGALPPLKACLEAILMVVDEPVTDVILAQVVERPKGEVAEALRELAEEYTQQGRGFELREVGTGDAGQTGWRMYSRPECAAVVERFVRDGQQAKLTQAALETLAVVAYRQPVSRSKVSAIRGVNCDGVMRTLLARGLVEECGTEHETGALLYQTTGYFLERMGLKGLDELPDLAPLLPSAAEIEDEA